MKDNSVNRKNEQKDMELVEITQKTSVELMTG